MRYYAFACACSSSTSSVALLLYSKPFFSFSVNAYKKTPLVYPPKVTYNRQKASQSASFCARQKRSFQHSVSRFLSLFFFAPLKRVARTYVRYRTKRERERERERGILFRAIRKYLKGHPGERSNWRHTQRASSSSRKSSSAEKDNENTDKNFIVGVA